MHRHRCHPVAVAVALVALSAAPAFAHGELEKTNPREGATLRSPPGVVSVTLTEPPTQQARFEVTDGCGRDLATGTSVDGNRLSAQIAGGEPGDWKASYQVISATDGHPTRGAFGFEVEGKADCSRKGEGSGKGDGSGNGDGSKAAGGNSNGDSGAKLARDAGGGLPVIPIALGAVVILVLAALARRTSAR